MDLLLKLCESERMGLILITHDLAGARYMCGRISVMYAGMIMET